ncbi:MAG TPA: DUF2207 domain-containing protein [Gemmatimonadaceae bacterium]|nr:DUF2207 domain-containing protein [Gemmatimonadaceae bacterium]
MTTTRPRRIVAACVAALLLLAASALSAHAQRSLQIDRFDAAIRVNRDATIDVNEAITVTFSGAWNGIYRTIPVVYHNPQRLNWTIDLDDIRATDEAGHTLKVERKREGKYAKLKIWVPGAVNATHTVALHYRATNALRFFDDHDELYWNVTGDEWDVPVGRASAHIELPPGATGIRAIAFNGAYHSTAQDAKVNILATTVDVVLPTPLGFHEGLTAVVGWDKGVVAQPGVVGRVAHGLAINWPLLIPPIALVVMFAIWRRRGRDPRLRPITVRYEPPAGLTPGEAGTLMDNKVDIRDITATLVDLAVRGHLKFVEEEKPRLFGLMHKTEYVLVKQTPPADAAPLAGHERRVLDGVFEGRGDMVSLSTLENEFYKAIPDIDKALFDKLLERRYYRARPDTVQGKWVALGMVVGLGLAVAGPTLGAKLLLSPVPFVIAGILTGIIMVGFGLIMPARTESGARALEATLGFEEFLNRVESEKYRHAIVGHPELFDRYLPYAMAFGVEKKWSHAFEGIYTQPPTWYSGPSVAHFSVGRLSSSLSNFSTRTSAALSSSPRSSGGSGFGGGGFSGGGGGGGGGGGF